MTIILICALRRSDEPAKKRESSFIRAFVLLTIKICNMQHTTYNIQYPRGELEQQLPEAARNENGRDQKRQSSETAVIRNGRDREHLWRL